MPWDISMGESSSGWCFERVRSVLIDRALTPEATSSFSEVETDSTLISGGGGKDVTLLFRDDSEKRAAFWEKNEPMFEPQDPIATLASLATCAAVRLGGRAGFSWGVGVNGSGRLGGGEVGVTLATLAISFSVPSLSFRDGLAILRAFQRPFNPSTVFSTLAEPAAKALDMASLVGANCWSSRRSRKVSDICKPISVTVDGLSMHGCLRIRKWGICFDEKSDN